MHAAMFPAWGSKAVKPSGHEHDPSPLFVMHELPSSVPVQSALLVHANAERKKRRKIVLKTRTEDDHSNVIEWRFDGQILHQVTNMNGNSKLGGYGCARADQSAISKACRKELQALVFNMGEHRQLMIDRFLKLASYNNMRSTYFCRTSRTNLL